MNLSAEAFRLAAIEALCPTAAIQSGSSYPTIAKDKVFDSRQIRVDELNEKAWTPTLALYTPDSDASQRGPSSEQDDMEATASLEIIGELAVAMRDNDGDFADAAVASGDPQARLILAALMAQVRYRLFIDPIGRALIKKVVLKVRKMDVKTFGIPELGLRYHRQTLRIDALVRDDDFSAADGALPQPLAGLAAALPAESYAKGKLSELAVFFAQPETVPLKSIHITTAGPVEFGPNFDT